MRLWHEALLPYLPRQQLLGQHREVCALRGRGWGRRHSVVNYVFEHPKEWLWAYHMRVMSEMLNRGYHPDMKWADMRYQGESLPLRDIVDGAEEVDMAGMTEKLESGDYIYPEHDDAYLEECLKNLEGKGIYLREQVDKND